MKKLTVTTALIILALLTSCTRQVGWVGLNYGNTYDFSYQFFDGKETEGIEIGAGDTFRLTYDIEVNDGALNLELVDPNRAVVWQANFLEDAKDVFEFVPESGGRYTLNIIGDGTNGGVELRWKISN